MGLNSMNKLNNVVIKELGPSIGLHMGKKWCDRATLKVVESDVTFVETVDSDVKIL